MINRCALLTVGWMGILDHSNVKNALLVYYNCNSNNLKSPVVTF